MSSHHYTDEEKSFILSHYKGVSNQKLVETFNNTFNANLTIGQMKSFKANRKLNSGLTGHFKKGAIPFNKGKHQKITGRMRETMFKKGQECINKLPIGSTRISKDGYKEIKVADPGIWKLYHRVVWEREHGKKVPKGHVVIFADGDHMNFSNDNLTLISRAELVVLNLSHGILQDADLTKTNINIMRINQIIKKRRKRNAV